jgi:opacity protein-like surface antigen
MAGLGALLGLPLRSWTLGAAVLLAVGASSASAAEPAAIGQTPLERMIDLNRRAFGDIQNQRFQAAKYWLTEALVISETAALENDEMTARTYVHLAAVFLTGFEDRVEAIRYFTLALKINPNITISAGLETPALKSAYLEAREDMGLPPAPDPTAAETAPASKSAAAPPPAVPPPLPPVPLPETGYPDPDPPARVPAPLSCLVPFEILAGQDLLVRCLTQRQQKHASAQLYFRVEGTTAKYAELPMAHTPKGWLVAVIPGPQIRGRSLSYFVKAQLPGSAEMLYNGYPEAPNALLIKAPLAADEAATTTAGPVSESAAGQGSISHRRPVGTVWFALGGGTGTVYHGREVVDTRSRAPGTTDLVHARAGFSGATLLHIEPELGYQITPRLSLSLLLRYQHAPPEGVRFVPEEGQNGILTSAFAGFARAQISLPGRGRLQPYASVGAGGGRSFLAVIGRRCPPGQCALDHSDTLHGGPVGLTAGLGVVYRFSPRFGLVLDVKEIMTVPKVMALTEFSLGFEIAHRFRSPAPPGGAPGKEPVAFR